MRFRIRAIRLRSVLAWVAIFATAVLGMQLYFIVESFWNISTLEMRALSFGVTLAIVLGLGYARKSMEGLMIWKGKQT